jgi:molybdopterin-biosynthesis enzyme MoeA-like protein
MKWAQHPGMWFENKWKVVISMPGVPHEMHHMLNDKGDPGDQKKISDTGDPA